jgi:hypothetical protein
MDITLLTEDLLLVVFSFVPGASNLLNLSLVSKRFRRLLTCSVAQKIQERTHGKCSTLEDLALYEAVHAAGLFNLGSDKMDADDPNEVPFYAHLNFIPPRNEATVIKHSRRRLTKVANILRRFANSRVVINAHADAGETTAAARRLSANRGQTVIEELCDQLGWNSNGCQRVQLCPWGRAIMPEISRASHKYTALAREGKGCVELSL